MIYRKVLKSFLINTASLAGWHTYHSTMLLNHDAPFLLT